jgi:hypothetical protein
LTSQPHLTGMGIHEWLSLGLAAGFFKVMLQISLVVVIVAGGRWLISWLQRRRVPEYSG